MSLSVIHVGTLDVMELNGNLEDTIKHLQKIIEENDGDVVLSFTSGEYFDILKVVERKGGA